MLLGPARLFRPLLVTKSGEMMGTQTLEQDATTDVVSRARASLGTSNLAIYQMVAEALRSRNIQGGTFVDIGCGSGGLYPFLQDRCSQYVGVDLVRYDGFPAGLEFHEANLDADEWELPPIEADVVVAVETIEHLENPRAFFRQLVRIAKPGGWVIVTTPKQVSLLSKLTLLLKNEFNAFRDSAYPAHITALLEIDLRRIAQECKLTDVGTAFSLRGRLPGLSWHFPKFLSRWFSRSLSDNILAIGRRAGKTNP